MMVLEVVLVGSISVMSSGETRLAAQDRVQLTDLHTKGSKNSPSSHRLGIGRVMNGDDE